MIRVYECDECIFPKCTIAGNWREKICVIFVTSKFFFKVELETTAFDIYRALNERICTTVKPRLYLVMAFFNVYLNESLTRKFVEKEVDANCDSEQLVKQIFICSVNKRNKSS